MSARRPFIDLAPAHSARGRVRVPGSKSISNRVLLLAAMAEGTTRISDLLHSDDTTVMIRALRALGVPMRETDAGLDIDGAATFPNRDADLFVGNSGLAIRTLTAALAFAHGRYRISGIARMHERPIGDLVDALRALGARIEYEASEGNPPLRIESPASMQATASLADERRERCVRVRGDTSSQFLTGLLQAAPLLAADADVIIEVVGPLISRPYVDLTIALMKRFGVIVDEERSNRFAVAKGSRYISPGQFVVEGDASSASYLLAAGLLGGGPVRVEGMVRNSLQGDARFVDVLIAMGAEIAVIDDAVDDAIEVRSPGVASGFRLRAIDADFNDIPDAAMTVAVLALFADGPSTLRNIGSWRVKETDRLAAMANELKKFGAIVEAGDDWLRIEPTRVPTPDPSRVPTQEPTREPTQVPTQRPKSAPVTRPIVIDTYDDHRIAMCFSLATFLGVPIRINDPDCVAKTFPDYFQRFDAIVEHAAAAAPVIAIDGPTASGKGSVAHRVADALGFHVLDSGALYRLTAYAAVRDGVDATDSAALAACALALAPHFDAGRIVLDAIDVTDAIREERIGNLASSIAALPEVRAALLDRQRAFQRAPGLVADGRDMGTVVFPRAALKIFLVADVTARTARRHKQLIEKGIPAKLPTLLRELQERDRRDANRSVSPLAVAADAVTIDSSDLDLDDVVARVLQLAKQRGLQAPV